MNVRIPGKKSKKAPGRPPAVDTPAIAQAVLAVGFERLTFAAVAEHLGISQATLFSHVANRDILVSLGLQLAIERYEWPSVQGPWEEMLQRWAIASWRCWEQHPGAVIEASRGVVPPAMAALAEKIACQLMKSGFGAAEAVLSVDAVFDMVSDNRRGVETLDRNYPGDGPTDATISPMGQRELIRRQWQQLSLPTGKGTPEHESNDDDSYTQAIREEMLAAIKEEPYQWFLGKLRIVLAGVRTEMAPGSQEIREHTPMDGDFDREALS